MSADLLGPLGGVGLMLLMRDRLAWVDQRQTVLAQNIANADTPGFVPSDLAPFGAIVTRRQVAMARTSAGHLAGSAVQPAGAAPEADIVRSPDGNGVSLEKELMHIADNQTAQQISTQLYSKYMGLFRTALGRGS